MPTSIGIRPLGVPRRMGTVPMGPVSAGSGDSDTVRRLFDRASIAGRDGTLAQSGATGSTALHPTLGSVVSAGALISHNLAIPGVGVLPMSFAQGARTNLCPAVTTLNGATTSLSGLSRSVVESSGGTVHLVYSAAASISAATNYRLRVAIKPVGDRLPRIFLQDNSGSGANIAGVRLSSASVATTSVAGGGSATIHTQSVLPDGSVYVEATIALSAVVGSVFVLERIYDGANSASYSGDGASGAIFTAATIENATFSGLGLAEGATRTADNVLWSPPSALSTVAFDLIAVDAQYLASGDMGVATQSMFEATNSTVYPRMLRTSSTLWTFTGRDSVPANYNKTIGSVPGSSGQLRMLTGRLTASGVNMAQGADAFGAETALVTPPWVTGTQFVIGVSSSAGRERHGFVGLIYVPGGLTAAERTALARLTAGSLSYVG